jgi:hypothetical protein
VNARLGAGERRFRAGGALHALKWPKHPRERTTVPVDPMLPFRGYVAGKCEQGWLIEREAGSGAAVGVLRAVNAERERYDAGSAVVVFPVRPLPDSVEGAKPGMVDFSSYAGHRKTGRDCSVQLMRALVKQGGRLALHDKSDPVEVRRVLDMSKKQFRSALGMHLSKRRVILSGGEVVLVDRSARKQMLAESGVEGADGFPLWPYRDQSGKEVESLVAGGKLRNRQAQRLLQERRANILAATEQAQQILLEGKPSVRLLKGAVGGRQDGDAAESAAWLATRQLLRGTGSVEREESHNAPLITFDDHGEVVEEEEAFLREEDTVRLRSDRRRREDALLATAPWGTSRVMVHDDRAAEVVSDSAEEDEFGASDLDESDTEESDAEESDVAVEEARMLDPLGVLNNDKARGGGGKGLWPVGDRERSTLRKALRDVPSVKERRSGKLRMARELLAQPDLGGGVVPEDESDGSDLEYFKKLEGGAIPLRSDCEVLEPEEEAQDALELLMLTGATVPNEQLSSALAKNLISPEFRRLLDRSSVSSSLSVSKVVRQSRKLLNEEAAKRGDLFSARGLARRQRFQRRRVEALLTSDEHQPSEERS